MTRRVAFFCFECVEKYNGNPSIHCNEATGQILRAECEHCKKSRYGKMYEIIGGVGKTTKEPEPCP